MDESKTDFGKLLELLEDIKLEISIAEQLTNAQDAYRLCISIDGRIKGIEQALESVGYPNGRITNDLKTLDLRNGKLIESIEERMKGVNT